MKIFTNISAKERKTLKRLKRKGHSPAGARFILKYGYPTKRQKPLKRKKKKDNSKGTDPLYLKQIKRRSLETRMKESGLTEEDIRQFE